MAHKIYVYGEIYGGGYIAGDIRSQLMNIPQGEEIEVYINSPGGSVNEGFAIHDILATAPNPITTIGEGIVGSIATAIFLAGSKRKLTKNAQFFVHNPIVFPNDSLNADKLKELEEKLREVENTILDFYASKLGLGARKKKELYKLMQAETSLSAEQAIEFGFATELMPELMAMAKIDITDMDVLKNLGEKIASLAKKKTEETKTEEVKAEVIENLRLATEDGLFLEIQTKEKEPKVGDEVLIENNRANDREYFVPGMAKNIVVKGGKIDEIETRELELEKEVNDAEANKLAEDIQAQWQASVTAEVEARFKPVNESISNTNHEVAALGEKVEKYEGVITEQEKQIKAHQNFYEVQAKLIEEHKETTEAIKKDFADYKEKTQDILNGMLDEITALKKDKKSGYVPPLNSFTKEEVKNHLAPKTSFEKARAEIEKRTSK